MLFSARWLLEIEIERSATHWLVVDVVKRLQVWMTECLLNYKMVQNIRYQPIKTSFFG